MNPLVSQILTSSPVLYALIVKHQGEDENAEPGAGTWIRVHPSMPGFWIHMDPWAGKYHRLNPTSFFTACVFSLITGTYRTPFFSFGSNFTGVLTLNHSILFNLLCHMDPINLRDNCNLYNLKQIWFWSLYEQFHDREVILPKIWGWS